MIQNNWRIAVSEDRIPMGWFKARGVPPPDGFSYRNHAVKVNRYNGATGKHGYQNASIVWTRLTNYQATVLAELINFARDDSANGYLYMTIPRVDGEQHGMGWVDVYGYPNLSDLSASSPFFATGIMINNVELSLNNIIIINDPANNL